MDQTEVWDSRSHAVHSGGEEDPTGQNDPVNQVCLWFFTFLKLKV